MIRTPGNVFVFSFSSEGFEAIVNLTEIDQAEVMAKMADEKPTTTVSSILGMMQMRSRFNQQRNMEVWLVKLEEDVTEEYLTRLSETDPQAAAEIARQGTRVDGVDRTPTTRKVIV
jgi:hypothetical protein